MKYMLVYILLGLQSFTIIDLFLPPLLLFPPFPWIQFWATPLHSVFPDTHCLRTFLLSSPSPLPVFRSLFPFESIHYVHLCQWLGINGATLLQTMTSEPVHGQITFRGNFSIPPSSLQSIREKKGKKKKEKLFTKMFRPFTMQPVCSFVELRTRHQLIANHDTANARASPCP